MSNLSQPKTVSSGQEKVNHSSINRGAKGNSSLYEIYRDRFIHSSVYQNLSFIKDYFVSYYKGPQHHELFEQIETYCLFTGHARSGHSIVGALLDAHPNAVIADELDALKYVAAGFSRDQVYYLALAKSQKLHKRGRQKDGRDGKAYSNFVPGQWQGRFKNLQVIGDTRAGGSTIRIGQDPTILQRLQDLMPGANLRIINIVRNPYDNISTKIIRRGMSFEQAMGDYFRNCAIIDDLYKRLDRSQFLMMRQEDFINQPRDTLRQMCEFLGLDAPNDYLDACTNILYKSPAKSRHKVDWSPELIEHIQQKIDQFDFLAGYTYDN